MLRCRLRNTSSLYVRRHWWRGLEVFKVGDAPARLWVGCLMDGRLPPQLYFVSLPPADDQAHYYGSEIKKKKGGHYIFSECTLNSQQKEVYSFPTPACGYVTPTQVAPCQCFHWTPSPPPPPPTLGSSPRRCHGRRHRKFWLASEPRLSRLPSCHDAAVNRFRVCHWRR